MTALLKYDIRKTWIAKAIILGIAAVAELLFLVSLYILRRNDTAENLTVTAIFLLVMTCFCGILYIGIQSVITLHRDMNTKQGYMLYMTPKNSYQILGAKMLENGFSLLLAGAFFSLLALLDVSLLFGRVGQLEFLWNTIREVLLSVDERLELNTQGLLVFMLSFLASWLATVSVAYLADIISSALLNGKRFNGLITFVLFILLSLLGGWFQRLFVNPGMTAVTLLLVQSLVALVYSAAMYVSSAVIMDRFLSV